ILGDMAEDVMVVQGERSNDGAAMVMSDLCRMSSADKKDCEFDHGGYFIIKGAEKTFIAQEQICLRRLSISKDPTWTATYRAVEKRKRVYIKLTSKTEKVLGADKILTVYFYVTEIPIWVLFFALGVTNDKKIADIRFEIFAKREMPLKQKASFLAYMVKCLLEAYRGLRKTDNRDDLKNKRLEVAEEEKDEEIGRDRAKSTKASPPLPQSTTDTGSTETTTANSDDEKLGFFSDSLWVNVIVPTRNPSSQGVEKVGSKSGRINGAFDSAWGCLRVVREAQMTTNTFEKACRVAAIHTRILD
ncbi:DNA-directed RNA polymerase, partial [Striga asiatica]